MINIKYNLNDLSSELSHLIDYLLDNINIDDKVPDDDILESEMNKLKALINSI